MSLLVICDRCKTTIEATDDKELIDYWAELRDARDNALSREDPTHLCTKCVKAFREFMNPPMPSPPQENKV